MESAFVKHLFDAIWRPHTNEFGRALAKFKLKRVPDRDVQCEAIQDPLTKGFVLVIKIPIERIGQ